MFYHTAILLGQKIYFLLLDGQYVETPLMMKFEAIETPCDRSSSQEVKFSFAKSWDSTKKKLKKLASHVHSVSRCHMTVLGLSAESYFCQRAKFSATKPPQVVYMNIEKTD